MIKMKASNLEEQLKKHKVSSYVYLFILDNNNNLIEQKNNISVYQSWTDNIQPLVNYINCKIFNCVSFHKIQY